MDVSWTTHLAIPPGLLPHRWAGPPRGGGPDILALFDVEENDGAMDPTPMFLAL